MNSVEFDNEKITPRYHQNQNAAGLTGFLLKTGLISKREHAVFIFLIVILICIGLTGFLLYNTFKASNSTSGSQAFTAEQLQTLKIQSPALYQNIIFQQDNHQ